MKNLIVYLLSFSMICLLATACSKDDTPLPSDGSAPKNIGDHWETSTPQDIEDKISEETFNN